MPMLIIEFSSTRRTPWQIHQVRLTYTTASHFHHDRPASSCAISRRDSSKNATRLSSLFFSARLGEATGMLRPAVRINERTLWATSDSICHLLLLFSAIASQDLAVREAMAPEWFVTSTAFRIQNVRACSFLRCVVLYTCSHTAKISLGPSPL